MTILEKHIDFKILSPNEFEELCFEVIMKHGFSSIIWRQGGADNGRDIEATFTSSNGIVGAFNEKYFFECKKYEKGVPPVELYSKIAWADAEKPQHLVFFISSYLSNGAREWIEKVKIDKHYKIHIIEGKQLSHMLQQHNDIVAKYFINDKYLNLLNETIEKWVIHNLTPNFYTYQYLLEHLDKESLSINQIVFLYTLYFVHYSRLEELENELYHGIEITTDINQLSEILKKNNNCNQSVLISENNFNTLGGEGFLNIDEENISKFRYDFIAAESCTGINDHNGFKLCSYMFRRLSKNESIEIILYQNSSLEFKIRYCNNYNNEVYIEAVNLLNFPKSFVDKLLNLSIAMK